MSFVIFLVACWMVFWMPDMLQWWRQRREAKRFRVEIETWQKDEANF